MAKASSAAAVRLSAKASTATEMLARMSPRVGESGRRRSRSCVPCYPPTRRIMGSPFVLRLPIPIYPICASGCVYLRRGRFDVVNPRYGIDEVIVAPERMMPEFVYHNTHQIVAIAVLTSARDGHERRQLNQSRAVIETAIRTMP